MLISEMAVKIFYAARNTCLFDLQFAKNMNLRNVLVMGSLLMICLLSFADRGIKLTLLE